MKSWERQKEEEEEEMIVRSQDGEILQAIISKKNLLQEMAKKEVQRHVNYINKLQSKAI